MYPECMFFPTGKKKLIIKPVEIPDLPVVSEPKSRSQLFNKINMNLPKFHYTIHINWKWVFESAIESLEYQHAEIPSKLPR